MRGLTGSGSKVPNSFSVGDFGVAVNAKYDRFGCGPRTRVMYVRRVLVLLPGDRVGAERLLEPRRRVPALGGVRLVDDHRVPLAAQPAPAILSSTNGYFCSVLMMIFDVESSSASAS